MKRILIALAAVLALSGCTIDEPTSSPSPTVHLTGAAMDQAYLNSMRGSGYPIFSEEMLPDAQMIAFGHKMCDSLESGTSYQSIAASASASGFSPYEIGFVLGASIVAYCPDLSYLIPASN